MSTASLAIDPRTSRAILIGNNYRGANGFDSLYPAVRNNLWDLGAALRRPDILGVGDVLMVEDRRHHEVLDLVRENCCDGEQLSLLILYYAGHALRGDGRLSDKHELYLVAPNTRDSHRHDSAIPYSHLRGIIEEAKASYVLVLLDCCFSGTAVSRGGVAPRLSAGGTFVLAACHETKEALWPKGARYTGFTGALIEVLSKGFVGEGEGSTPRAFSLDSFAQAVKRRCKAENIPEPRYVSQQEGAVLNFALNVAYTGLITPADKKLLTDAGLGDELSSILSAGSSQELVEKLDERVYEEVQHSGAKAILSPAVVTICRRHKPFLEFHQNDWKRYYVQRQIADIEIDEAGNADFCVQSWIRTGSQPVRSLWRYAFGDEEVDGMDLLALEFESPGRESFVIPLVDEKTRKEFVAYIVPPIEPKSKDVNYLFRWHWPHIFAKLMHGEPDCWAFRVRSATKKIDFVSHRFWVPESWSKPLRIKVEGPGDAAFTVLNDRVGLVGYECKLTSLEANTSRVVLELQFEEGGAGGGALTTPKG
jgi:hypothetical protein